MLFHSRQSQKPDRGHYTTEFVTLPDMVTVSMATTPARAGHALKVARELRPQCDRLQVYVNGVVEGCHHFPGNWMCAPDGDLAAAGPPGRFGQPPPW